MFDIGKMHVEKKLVLREIIVAVGLCTTVCAMMLGLSVGDLGIAMYISYLYKPMIFVLNFLPILGLYSIIYFMLEKVWLSYFITALMIEIAALVNYFKLLFRYEPLYIQDIKYVTETGGIIGRYELVLPNVFLISFLIILLITVLLWKYHKDCNIITGFKQKFIVELLVICICVGGFATIYKNNSLYNSLSNTLLASQYSETQQYISRGFLYPFIRSFYREEFPQPTNYDENAAKAILEERQYSDIADSKKVNIIAIMLEAYSTMDDFSNIDFMRNPFEIWNELEKESYVGDLVPAVFAGGTIDTERKFLTGYTTLPDFRIPTSSYVWYLKEQGYYTEGAHPNNQWFYNRKSVNENLGFANYYFFENRYDQLTGGIIPGDNYFFNDILTLYNNRNKDMPYFGFFVTYETHGPYSELKSEQTEDFVRWKEGYNQEDYNIANNYFTKIQNTTIQIRNLIETLRKDESPTIVVLFGDHNPWFGNLNSVYEMLDVNIEVDTKDGFFNYYRSPYLIWGNEAAKNALGKEIVGKGPTISPNFLMNVLFEKLEYQGNQFYKLTNDVYKDTKIIHKNTPLLKTEESLENTKLNSLLNAQYYLSTEVYHEKIKD